MTRDGHLRAKDPHADDFVPKGEILGGSLQLATHSLDANVAMPARSKHSLQLSEGVGFRRRRFPAVNYISHKPPRPNARESLRPSAAVPLVLRLSG
jgi:hypothetical protein